MLALAKVLHLYPALFHQSLETEIDAAKTDAQLLGQASLAEIRTLFQTEQDFKLDFFLKTSQFLKWGYEVQGDLGMLPPCVHRTNAL